MGPFLFADMPTSHGLWKMSAMAFFGPRNTECVDVLEVVGETAVDHALYCRQATAGARKRNRIGVRTTISSVAFSAKARHIRSGRFPSFARK
jgi:hypothetical protein